MTWRSSFIDYFANDEVNEKAGPGFIGLQFLFNAVKRNKNRKDICQI